MKFLLLKCENDIAIVETINVVEIVNVVQIVGDCY